MKVLVTGASGLLGSQIVKVLLQKGYAVRAMYHRPELLVALDNLDADKVQGDIQDPAECRSVMEGCDCVIHAAASTSIWPPKSRKVWQTNLRGTVNIIDAAKQTDIRRLVYISTASCYPHLDPRHPEARDTIDTGLDYITSKCAAQRYVLDQFRNEGLPALVVAPTFMIGPNDNNLGSGRLVATVVKHKMRLISKGGKNFVYTGDVAIAAANALVMGTPGTVYLAGNQNLSYRTFFSIIDHLEGRVVRRLVLPDRLISSMGWLNHHLAILFGRRPLLSYPEAMASIEQHYFPVADAVTGLDMPQTDIELVLPETIKWLKEHGYC